MKKLLGTLVALVGVGAMGLAYANGAGNGLALSPHDFTDDVVAGTLTTGSELGAGGGWNFRGEMCRTCHVPHDHGRTGDLWMNGLLWNHDPSTLDGSFTMYDNAWSPSMTSAQDGQPSGTAKMCLGCHDGVTAIDAFDKQATANGYDGSPGGSTPYTTFMDDYDDGFIIGYSAGDMRGNHPLSITYDAGDPELNATNTSMGDSGTIADVLDNGKVQCSSCHDVHDQDSIAGTHLLRLPTKSTAVGDGNASALCLACHIK